MSAVRTLSVVALVTFAAGPGGAATKIPILVSDLKGEKVEPELAKSLTRIVANEIGKVGVFHVLSTEDVRAMVALERDRSLLGTESEDALAQLGNAMGARLLVHGTLSSLDAGYVVQLQLVDSRAVKVLARETAKVSGSVGKLLEEVGGPVRRLVSPVLASHKGTLQVLVSEEGANVFVDDRLVGISPLPPFDLAWGPHLVKVTREGFISWAREVEVAKDQTSLAQATLIPSPEFRQGYVRKARTYRALSWVAGGLGAALAAGALGLYVHDNQRYDALRDDYPTLFDDDPLNDAGVSAVQARRVESDVKAINKQDTAALVMAVAGAALCGTGLYLRFAGDDPGRYRLFEGAPAPAPAGASAPTAELSPLLGEALGATFTARW